MPPKVSFWGFGWSTNIHTPICRANNVLYTQMKEKKERQSKMQNIYPG